MTRPCFGRHEGTFQTRCARVTLTTHSARQLTPSHEHDFLCLHFVLAGGYEESGRRGRSLVMPGEVLFKPARWRHWNDFAAGSARTLRVEVEPGQHPSLPHRLPDAPRITASRSLGELMSLLQDEVDQPDGLSREVVDAAVEELLHELSWRRAGDEEVPLGAARECALWLDRNFAERVGLESAATALGINRTQLARAFRRLTGRTVGEYIRRRRVAYVLQALRRGDTRSLADLASAAGFSDQAHMTRCFRRLRGRPPGRWRWTGPA